MNKIKYLLISSAAFYFVSGGIAFAAVPGAPTLSVGSKNNQSGINVLNWMVPADGGQALTNYKIYRGNASGAETFLTQITAGTIKRRRSFSPSFSPGIRAPKPKPFADFLNFSINIANAQTTPTTSYIDNIGTSYSNRKPWYYKISAVNAAGEGP